MLKLFKNINGLAFCPSPLLSHIHWLIHFFLLNGWTLPLGWVLKERAKRKANPRAKWKDTKRKPVIFSKRFLLKNGFNLVDYNAIAIHPAKEMIKTKRKEKKNGTNGNKNFNKNGHRTYLIPFDKLFAILKCFGHFNRSERYVCSGRWCRAGCVAWTTLLWICSDGGGRWWRWCFWWCLMLWRLLLRFRCKCWCCHFCIWISHRRTPFIYVYVFVCTWLCFLLWLDPFRYHGQFYLHTNSRRRNSKKRFVSFAQLMQQNVHAHKLVGFSRLWQKSFGFSCTRSNCNQTTSWWLRFVSRTRTHIHTKEFFFRKQFYFERCHSDLFQVTFLSRLNSFNEYGNLDYSRTSSRSLVTLLVDLFWLNAMLI